MKIVIPVFSLLLFTSALHGQRNFTSRDFYVASAANINIFVRELSTAAPGKTILLVHGGVGSLAAFDPDEADGSFAKDLAAKGLKVYIMDVRGWERSSFPDTTGNSVNLASYIEAAADIDAVINEIMRINHLRQVILFGWASGGHWASYYTTLHNEKVERLIVLNSLYGVKGPWTFTDAFKDPDDPTQYNEKGLGKIRRSSKESLVAAWDKSIPTAQKDLWRDPAKAAAYQNTAVSFTKDATITVPGDFRKEAFYMANGRKYWDGRDIKVPVLLIRGALDFWTRPIDIDTFCRDLVNAPRKKCITIENATHMVFLDRPEKGRDRLIQEMMNFIR